MCARSIHVAPLAPTLRSALLDLYVHPAQLDFVGRISDLLADAERCPDCKPMLIFEGDTPIGFYRIDPHPRSVTGRELDEPALGLRGLFIDARWQGRGRGTAALQALLADLRQRFPVARLLALTVSIKNTAAVALYLHGGFQDSGELYHGGRAGPQHLLLCRLHS